MKKIVVVKNLNDKAENLGICKTRHEAIKIIGEELKKYGDDVIVDAENTFDVLEGKCNKMMVYRRKWNEKMNHFKDTEIFSFSLVNIILERV